MNMSVVTDEIYNDILPIVEEAGFELVTVAQTSDESLFILVYSEGLAILSVIPPWDHTADIKFDGDADNLTPTAKDVPGEPRTLPMWYALVSEDSDPGSLNAAFQSASREALERLSKAFDQLAPILVKGQVVFVPTPTIQGGESNQVTFDVATSSMGEMAPAVALAMANLALAKDDQERALRDMLDELGELGETDADDD